MEFIESVSVEDVSWFSVVPAWIARKDGGATPRKVPMKKGISGTPITGDVMLMNQLGRNGVIRKNMM